MNILMIILAVVGGAFLSMQAAIGGKLGSNVGVFRSAFPDLLYRGIGYRSADLFL